ncbi:carboxypeptidase-like regulatory domain-containing protein [Trinickia fusca]|uniref:Carboxypeptidase regulatory-like domain-containing protein n=1 Tax=Trinickia fusca TaxID=2419777 RepID=A0A494XET6_9BURK|nr:carboxypeptidase-like regulatory domain-containing protein [Trinickia fusca]RKP48402.1 carboxypeptidase regulatory-like domain-containing protein [Trinickia fusca]
MSDSAGSQGNVSPSSRKRWSAHLHAWWANVDAIFPFLVFILLLSFIVVSCLAAIKLGGLGDWKRYSPFVALIILSVAFGLWFMDCFTGDPDRPLSRRQQSFKFAYMFTMTTFVVMIYPMVNPWQPDILGPISLIRGCVDAQKDTSVPMSIRCGPTDLFPNAAPATTLTAANSGNDASLVSNVASASASASSDSQEGTVDAMGPSRRYTERKGFDYRPSYPWLVVIGGTYGTDAGLAEKAATNPPLAGPYQIVEGGFVLPFYILLLALIGAAISLTRRIPELQKRSEPGYVGTDDQPPLDNRTVREAVVFQIMQLITAPFIAMVAYYAIAPNGVASGIALAFMSGFGSELVLLQIRGVVEGLHPKSSVKLGATSTATGVGAISGTVVAVNGQPVSGVTVTVQKHSELTAVTDSDGAFTIENVPPGDWTLDASGGSHTGSACVTIVVNCTSQVKVTVA